MVTDSMLNVIKYDVLGRLPDPFVFDDGRKVETKEDWAERRKELYRYVVELQYGTQPPKPEVFRVEHMFDAWPKGQGTYRITAGTKEKQLSFRMKVIMPKDVTNPPVIVDGDLCFNYVCDGGFISAATDEGIAWALFDRTELANDVYSESCRGHLKDIYPEYTFGALGAWAWGYMRVVDALLELGIIDETNIAFTGHSRGGKTAMLAGVMDERAAIVAPNETNAGSCSCYRIHMTASYEGGPEMPSETLDNILTNFPHWFGPGMHAYRGCEEKLPFDCHELKAMIAPRTLFVAEAAGDTWTNQVGSWQTTMAAKKVFDFLGAGDELFWYYRPGFHYHKPEDVKMLVSLIKRRRDGGADFDDSEFFHLPFKPKEFIF